MAVSHAGGYSAAKAPQYQPEIDGLRAIAVLSVVLFHAEFKWIPGGFVGVDVFFVISGFLITRLLVKDVRAGTFSLGKFYLRRMLRLGPALIVMLTATFVTASFFLTPDHFQRLSGALLSSVFSLSNFFFWTESGYFDASAELKPLLHTWSLSVEEQFYMVWPVLIALFAVRREWVLPAVILLLSLASVIAALVFTSYEPSASFYLMPFRVYEFGLGAGLALFPAMRIPNVIKELFCLLGLLVIAYCALDFNKYTPFPDIYALLPCMGAALVIVGGSAQFLGLLLRNSLSVWIGKISYSLYLVHWPIVALYKHITFVNSIAGKTRIALLILTFMIAAVLYHGVERRFRLSSNSQSQGRDQGEGLGDILRRFGWLALPLVLSLTAVHTVIRDGWPWRFDDAVINAIGNIAEKQLIRREYIDGPMALSELAFDVSASAKVLVMGDSHSTDMFNALYLNVMSDSRISVRRLEIDDVCLYLFAKDSASRQTNLSVAEIVRCSMQFDTVQSSSLLAEADHIILSTRWKSSSFAYIERFSRFLVSRNSNDKPPELVFMGRTAEYKNVPSLILKRGLTEAIAQQLAEVRFHELDSLNAQLRQTVEALEYTYVDKLPFLCRQDANRCDAVNEQGQILYTDYGHWTMEGAELFGRRMLEDANTAVRLTGLPQRGS